MNWNLDDLYKGFDDPKYELDVLKVEKLIKEYNNLPNKFEKNDNLDVILEYIKLNEELTVLTRTLFSFNSLSNSVDVSNQKSLVNMAKLSKMLNETTEASVLFNRFLKDIDLNLYLNNEIIKNNLFQLQKIKKSSKYLLTEKEEIMYAKLQQVSSSSWSQLQSLLTSKLDVSYNDKTITLPEVRNLAYDNNAKVRKDAYYSELKAYEKVDEVVAMALSNIKREVVIMNDIRGYKDVYEPTLIRSNMEKATLDAMISAMKDYRPYFEEYLIAKAKYLGHDNALPFYDLFAPVGKLDKTYTYDEAKDIVINSFNSYSDKLGNYAKKAFDLNWIDPFPKKGKRGGAFCSNQPQLKQSRILSNFTGSLSDVSTLAHELGHGYHGEVISDNTPLNWSYPMPLAETASIFCETIVTNHLLSNIYNDEERLQVLEIALQGDTQVIIDILSRFIFEDSIFKLADGPISKEEMKKLMIEAQKEAYGKGLDSNFLHPYMWLNKGHYYSAGLNFYNFPYAFGLLFGKGLYSKYLEDKESFILNYDKLLKLTTMASVEDVAKSMNIDVTKKDFWISSLELIKKDIDEVIRLLNK
ncbi:M3 family oligoendopeptidase [Haploplasma modicum]|uniref:M3 family oligoendopeptidase n=1 Tax=Haploplasma modicum TaxID=2150 RepID=UPI00214BCF58|nr:M3 family oligoendopeptidase [Haploplasma modicum]MCR1809293.1 M3 family oligoendopeptidase [Haploplasma modicum]